MEVGANHNGLHQVAQDNGWSRYHMGDRKQANQVRTLPAYQRNGQDGETH